MQKFGRVYRLTINPLDGGAPIIIQNPLTVKIDCLRGLDGSANLLDVDIYNLSVDHRRRIYQDKNVLGQYFNANTPAGASPVYFNILLEAGYGSQLNRIFYGHMLWADSIREGTNIVTHISASSQFNDVAGSQIQVTLKNTPLTAAQILSYLVTQLPNLTLGALGNFPTVFNKPVALNGLVWPLIRQYSFGGSAFIDDGKVYILNNNEVTGGIFVINDATGIIETPRRQEGLLIVTTLMETGVQLIGQMAQIQSTVAPQYNGIYKVLNVRHTGIISDAVCGRMLSTFWLQASGLYNGPNGLPSPGNGFTTIPLAQAVAS